MIPGWINKLPMSNLCVCLCYSLFKMGIQSVTTFAFQEHTYQHICTMFSMYHDKTVYKTFLDPPPHPSPIACICRLQIKKIYTLETCKEGGHPCDKGRQSD